jgi:hypothetical protein
MDEVIRFIFLVKAVFPQLGAVSNRDGDAHLVLVPPAAHVIGRAAGFEVKIDNIACHRLQYSETINDAGLVHIVRRHLDLNAITDDETDEFLAHLTGDVSQHFVAVFQLHAEHGSCKNGGNGAFQLDGFFLLLGIVLDWFWATWTTL